MPRGRVQKTVAAAEINEQSALEKLQAENAQMKIRMAQMEEFIRNNPAGGKPKAVEQFVLVAALHPTKTRFGGENPIVFLEKEGYDYPVAEMEATRAKRIITAEVDNKTYNFCYATDINKVVPLREVAQ
jgi:hypothetical protein